MAGKAAPPEVGERRIRLKLGGASKVAPEVDPKARSPTPSREEPPPLQPGTRKILQ